MAIVESLARILVVDDDLAIVDLVAAILRRENYRVLAATDGRQALEEVRRHSPQLDTGKVLFSIRHLVP